LVSLELKFKAWLAKIEDERGFRSLSPVFRQKVRQDYYDRVKKYCENVEEIYSSQGWKRVQQRRQFDNHLCWAIQWQLKPSKTYEQIAEDNEKDEKTVKIAITKLLDTAGITRRTRQ